MTTPPPGSANNAVMYREEIIGSRPGIAGYRFQPRCLDGGKPDAAAQVALLRNEAIDRLAQRRLALIPLDSRDWAAQDFRQFVAPFTLFLLQAPPPDAGPEAWLAVAKEIRGGGGRLALTMAGAAIPSALAFADTLLLDFSAYELAALERLVAGLRSRYPRLQLLAERVRAWPEHRLCLSWGIHYSLGEFAVQPDQDENPERLGQNKLVLLKLLQLLRQEADPDQLAAAAKQDPVVVAQVLAMVNSPAAGLRQPVSCLAKALLVLGRDYLYRWLSISLFRVGGRPRDEALLELALQRARFLELLAAPLGRHEAGHELFLVGILSLADVLLGMPPAQVAAHLRLPADVAAVLAHSTGPYAHCLRLAVGLERGHTEQAGRLADTLGIEAATLNAATRDARQWVEQALAGA